MVDVKKVSEATEPARYEIVSYKMAVKKEDGQEIEVIDDLRRQYTTIGQTEQEITRATEKKEYWEEVKAKIQALKT